MNGYEWGLVDLTMTWAFCCDAEQVHRDMVVPFPLTANSTAKRLVIPVWTKMILPNAFPFGWFGWISHESKKPFRSVETSRSFVGSFASGRWCGFCQWVGLLLWGAPWDDQPTRYIPKLKSPSRTQKRIEKSRKDTTKYHQIPKSSKINGL